MSFVPTFKLYDYTGVNLLYTFEAVQYTNMPGQDTNSAIIIEGIRAKGCLIIGGGEVCSDIIIRGIFVEDDYEALVVKMDALKAVIVFNTRYKLRLDKTISTYYEYDVKRIEPIDFPESLRTSEQIYNVILKNNSW